MLSLKALLAIHGALTESDTRLLFALVDTASAVVNAATGESLTGELILSTDSYTTTFWRVPVPGVPVRSRPLRRSTLVDYYAERHGIELRHPGAPVFAITNRGGYVPAELLLLTFE